MRSMPRSAHSEPRAARSAANPLANWTWLIVTMLAFQPLVAHGQDGGVDRTAAARALFHEGVELADRTRWAEAADRFDRAYQLRPEPIVAFNLATALRRSGRLVRANEVALTLLRADDTPPEMRNPL